MKIEKQIVKDKLEIIGFLDDKIARETKFGYKTTIVENFDFNKGDMVKITIERVPTVEKERK